MPAIRGGALLFDLDGTLIDSMPLHHESWKLWHAARGLAFDDAGFFAATAGRTNAEILADLYPGTALPEIEAMAEHKEVLYRELAATRLGLIAGAMDALAWARGAGWPLAICTASPPGNLQVAFDRFGFGALVDTVTSPADGLRGKPHPDIFAEAARRLGAEPARCVVFEDAPLGVEAARRAGMLAVALTTTLPAEAFSAFTNLIGVGSDFTRLDLPKLLETHHA
jgi:beta-phosphoglucomutase